VKYIFGGETAGERISFQGGQSRGKRKVESGEMANGRDARSTREQLHWLGRVIEFTSIGMFAIDAGNGVFRKVAGVGVRHEATRETERICHVAGPTYFRVWQMPLTTG
jgi:hypothetical protein